MSDNIKNPEDITPEDGDKPSDNRENDENSELKSEDIKETIPVQKDDKSEPENPFMPAEKSSSSQETHKPKKALNLNKESNYQISLIDHNLLKVTVSTDRGVKINSLVKNRKTSSETQDNEIYLFPKLDSSVQEIEVMIEIDTIDTIVTNVTNVTNSTDEEIKKDTETINLSDPAEEISEEKDAIQDLTPPQVPEEKTVPESSNYQINLINENLLKVRIETKSGVKIESVSRDKRTSVESQSNRIHLHPVTDNELQTVDITIEIDTEKKEITQKDDEGNIRLIPNPEVVDLIQPPTYPVMDYMDEVIDPETGYKNPFDALRKLIQRNTTIGIVAAVILHIVAAGFVYFNYSKPAKDQTNEEQSRLIVLQDLPDPKIKLQDVEDPNKPKVVPPLETAPEVKEPVREVKPRKTVKPPTVTRPNRDNDRRDTLSEADLVKELDSLRRLAEGTGIDSLRDSTKTDTTGITYEIPDSLRNNFNENDIGLAMYFPKNWKLTDQREINKNEKDFKGVLLTDTTAEQTGTMTFFIYLDPEKKDFNTEDFKTEFPMNDSTLTAFLKEPKTLAGFTEYRFYVFNKIGTEKLSLRASVRKQFFDQYKNEIEAVVRSIRIQRPEPLKKDSLNSGDAG